MDMMEVRRRVMLSMASGSCLELLGEFTVAESRENDSLGNSEKILIDYVVPVIADYDISTAFLLVVENNTASNYVLKKIIWFGVNASHFYNTGSVLREQGGKYTLRAISTMTSSWCSLGTVLKLYRLKGV